MPPAFDPSIPDPRVRGEEYLELSWEMLGELCRGLAMRVGQEYSPELVVGIARAGVIPAAVLASILQVDFHAITISRREWGERIRERPAILSEAPARARDRRVILVDEVTTSGETFRMGLAALRDVAPTEIRTAAVFVRPRGYAPDFHALETDQTVVFPWDRKILEGSEWIVNPRYQGIIDE